MRHSNGEQSHAERQARHRARRVMEPVAVLTRTGAPPPSAAAARNVGARQSTSCWRCRPDTPSGSRPFLTASATAEQPRHLKPSWIWTSRPSPSANCPAVTAATRQTLQTRWR